MMKKLGIIAVLLFVLLAASAQAAALSHMADQAEIFSAEEAASLEERMIGLYQTYGFDMVIVTTRDLRGQSARMYAADFYDQFHDYDTFPNGMIFSFNSDLGEYYEAARGIGMTLFSDQGSDALDDLLRPYLDNRDYYGAMNRYLDMVEKKLSRHSIVNKDGTRSLSETPRLPTAQEAAEEAARFLPFMALGGVGIGFGSAFVMKSKLNIAKARHGAQGYADPRSLRLRDSSEIYLYQTVTRTRIVENKSSGGGSGGARFSSSSGRSYGGRGGKL